MDSTYGYVEFQDEQTLDRLKALRERRNARKRKQRKRRRITAFLVLFIIFGYFMFQLGRWSMTVNSTEIPIGTAVVYGDATDVPVVNEAATPSPSPSPTPSPSPVPVVKAPGDRVLTSELDMGWPGYFDVPLSDDLQRFIYKEASARNIPFRLILAMIWTESDYRAGIIATNTNGTTDHGLMQINSCHHSWLNTELGVYDFLDPYDNIRCGILLIGGHLDKQNGDIHKALMAYNFGEAGAKRHWEQGTLSSKYSRRIVERMDLLKLRVN